MLYECCFETLLAARISSARPQVRLKVDLEQHTNNLSAHTYVLRLEGIMRRYHRRPISPTAMAATEIMTCEFRYIKWTQLTFKAGGHKAEMMPLLERCTRQLQQQERYKKDPRYLRLWIQYVSPSSPLKNPPVGGRNQPSKILLAGMPICWQR